MKRLAAITILTLTFAASVLFAQRFGGGNGGGGARALGQNFGPTGGNCVKGGSYRGGVEDMPLAKDADRNEFVYARLRYHPQDWWRQHTGEVPWHHDYPDGDEMLPDALSRLTGIQTTRSAYQIVDVDGKELFKYPFIYLSEPGYLDLLPADVKNLREYLDRGGFLLIDDFRGNSLDNSEMENLVVQLKKVYPDRDLVPLKSNHAIFSAFFDDFDPAQMLPPYRMANSGEPQFLGMSDDKGRLQIMVDFNNDMSEYWQTLDVGICSIHEAGTAVKLGVNYVIYAMTH